jgi:hypothetical protein
VWRTVLLAVALQCARGQSIDCANNVTVDSDTKAGPSGVHAALRVHSEDDHSKNSHECEADYSLRIVLPDGREEVGGLIPPSGFMTSIGQWGRRLTLHLDGFSADGQHVFGVISEAGKYASITVFDFKRDGSHREIQVQKSSSRLKAAHCGASFAVAGMTRIGELVVEPDTEEPCRASYRWVLDKKGELRPLTKEMSFVGLYVPRS